MGMGVDMGKNQGLQQQVKWLREHEGSMGRYKLPLFRNYGTTWACCEDHIQRHDRVQVLDMPTL